MTSPESIQVSISPRPRRVIGRFGTAGLAGLLLIACSSDAGLASGVSGPYTGAGVGAPMPSSMIIAPTTITVNFGDSAQVFATPENGSGAVMSGVPIAWSSSDSDVVTVSSSGLVKAIGVGQATIVASAGAVTAQAQVVAGGVPVGSVRLTPNATTVGIGQIEPLAVAVLDGSGKVLAGRHVRWQSSNPAVATVDSTGNVTGVGTGAVVISGRSSDVNGTAAVGVITQPVTAPSTVTDLAAAVTSDTSVTITFTAVADGAGQPASYDLRYSVGSMNWTSASSVTSGSCTSPIAGGAIGSTVRCTVLGLSPLINYSLQIVAFRGTFHVNQVLGALSNVVTATTPAPGPTTSPTSVTTGAVASVAVTPTWVSQTVGQSTQLMAVVRDGYGNVMTGQSVAWTSSASSVASVNNSGLVTAFGAGTATITASSGGQSGTASITVANAAPVSPSTVTNLSANANSDSSAAITFTAVSDGTGQPASYDLRYAAGTISWGSAASVSQGSCAAPIAPVSIGSTVRCTALGLAPSTSYQFQVVAFSGTLNSNAVFGAVSNVASTTTAAAPPAAVASVTVTPSSLSGTVGQTGQLTAVVTDANGNTMTGQTITWTSSNSGVATVNASGLVSAVGAGSATITASTGGKSGTASVTVTTVAPVVASVTVSPSSVSNSVGQTAQLTAAAKDGSGNTMTGQSITWSSSNSSVATVNGSGLVSSVGVGTATITATSSGKSGTASVTVAAAAPVVGSVTVTPAALTGTVGQTGQLTAVVTDANGNTMTGQTITWTSSKTSVATVNGSGLVTAVSAGTATITASTSGKSGTASVTVAAAAPVVASVTVAPSSVSNSVGQTAQLSAVVKDGSGNTMTGQSITWSSSNSSVATVNTSGVVTSVAAGTATITASSSGKSGTVSVTVAAAAPVVASVIVTPSSASNTVGQTMQFATTVLDGTGTPITGQSISWTSSNTAVATVNGSGLATSVGAGTATIKASTGGQSGTASLTALAPPPPPPPASSADYPNLPSGLTIPSGYVDEFTNSSLNEGIYSNGGGAVQRNASTYTPSGGVTSPVNPPASPPYIGEMAYPVGFAGGGAPGNVNSADFSGNGYTHLYIAITVQFSSNFVGNPSGVNKTIYAWIHNNPCFYLSAQGSGTGELDWQMRLQNLGTGASAINLVNNVATGAVTRGSWQRIEVELMANTGGASNGVARMWVTNYNGDGSVASGPTLVANYTNIQWSGSGQSTNWNYIQWTPVWGGIGGTVGAVQYQWLDRMALGAQ